MVNQDEDCLKWARKNTIDSGKRNSYEKQKLQASKIANYDIEAELGLNYKTMTILEKVNDFDFDIFALERETGGNEMIVCATYLLQRHELFEKCSIDPTTFNKFITVIQTGYFEVAYHNKIHGMDVGRLAYYYATECELIEKAQLSDIDVLALIVGGACHDYEHLGWNNAYLIETQHDWAITYNDVSVCEHHHIAATFEVLKSKPGCNIFENFSLDDFKNIRKKLTKSVLATDMALHFDYVNKFKTFLDDSEVDMKKEENKIFLMCMSLHISDFTNPSKNWSESQKWTCLVYEEFFVQGDKEKELGLPIGMLNDRVSTNLAKSQMGFIDFIVQPSFELFHRYLPKVQPHIDQIKWNRNKWDSMVPECEVFKDDGNNLITYFRQLELEDMRSEGKSKSSRDSAKKTADVVDPFDDNFHGQESEDNKLDRPNNHPTLAQRADSEDEI